MTKIVNNISKPFEGIFTIMYGLVLVDACKNILTVFRQEQQHVGLIILTIVLALFFLLSAFETLLDFKIAKGKIERESARSAFIRYLVWFFQFIPFFLILDTIPKFEKADNFKSLISLSLGSIYMIYATINILQFKINNFLHYVFLSAMFGIYYFFKDFDDQLIFLNLVIVFVLLVYANRWKKRYFNMHLYGTN